ncbi:hypothetical protein DDE23_05240 [Pararhodobacter aggregans]|uniref:Uncharacterized protein n=1 Tax=Pararhodobacter aggregans TaxID=404875 RepID=A0A2T7UV64_9RHOB|nr:hypothetical protein DDE23_05240 [Pararhodobacter aggregans]
MGADPLGDRATLVQGTGGQGQLRLPRGPQHAVDPDRAAGPEPEDGCGVGGRAGASSIAGLAPVSGQGLGLASEPFSRMDEKAPFASRPGSAIVLGARMHG